MQMGKKWLLWILSFIILLPPVFAAIPYTGNLTELYHSYYGWMDFFIIFSVLGVIFRIGVEKYFGNDAKKPAYKSIYIILSLATSLLISVWLSDKNIALFETSPFILIAFLIAILCHAYLALKKQQSGDNKGKSLELGKLFLFLALAMVVILIFFSDWLAYLPFPVKDWFLIALAILAVLALIYFIKKWLKNSDKNKTTSPNTPGTPTTPSTPSTPGTPGPPGTTPSTAEPVMTLIDSEQHQEYKSPAAPLEITPTAVNIEAIVTEIPAAQIRAYIWQIEEVDNHAKTIRHGHTSTHTTRNNVLPHRILSRLPNGSLFNITCILEGRDGNIIVSQKRRLFRRKQPITDNIIVQTNMPGATTSITLRVEGNDGNEYKNPRRPFQVNARGTEFVRGDWTGTLPNFHHCEWLIEDLSGGSPPITIPGPAANTHFDNTELSSLGAGVFKITCTLKDNSNNNITNPAGNAITDFIFVIIKVTGHGNTPIITKLVGNDGNEYKNPRRPYEITPGGAEYIEAGMTTRPTNADHYDWLVENITTGTTVGVIRGAKGESKFEHIDLNSLGAGVFKITASIKDARNNDIQDTTGTTIAPDHIYVKINVPARAPVTLQVVDNSGNAHKSVGHALEITPRTTPNVEARVNPPTTAVDNYVWMITEVNTPRGVTPYTDRNETNTNPILDYSYLETLPNARTFRIECTLEDSSGNQITNGRRPVSDFIIVKVNLPVAPTVSLKIVDKTSGTLGTEHKDPLNPLQLATNLDIETVVSPRTTIVEEYDWTISVIDRNTGNIRNLGNLTTTTPNLGPGRFNRISPGTLLKIDCALIKDLAANEYYEDSRGNRVTNFIIIEIPKIDYSIEIKDTIKNKKYENHSRPLIIDPIIKPGIKAETLPGNHPSAATYWWEIREINPSSGKVKRGGIKRSGAAPEIWDYTLLTRNLPEGKSYRINCTLRDRTANEITNNPGKIEGIIYIKIPASTTKKPEIKLVDSIAHGEHETIAKALEIRATPVNIETLVTNLTARTIKNYVWAVTEVDATGTPVPSGFTIRPTKTKADTYDYSKISTLPDKKIYLITCYLRDRSDNKIKDPSTGNDVLGVFFIKTNFTPSNPPPPPPTPPVVNSVVMLITDDKNNTQPNNRFIQGTKIVLRSIIDPPTTAIDKIKIMWTFIDITDSKNLKPIPTKGRGSGFFKGDPEFQAFDTSTFVKANPKDKEKVIKASLTIIDPSTNNMLARADEKILVVYTPNEPKIRIISVNSNNVNTGDKVAIDLEKEIILEGEINEPSYIDNFEWYIQRGKIRIRMGEGNIIKPTFSKSKGFNSGEYILTVTGIIKGTTNLLRDKSKNLISDSIILVFKGELPDEIANYFKELYELIKQQKEILENEMRPAIQNKSLEDVKYASDRFFEREDKIRQILPKVRLLTEDIENEVLRKKVEEELDDLIKHNFPYWISDEKRGIIGSAKKSDWSKAETILENGLLKTTSGEEGMFIVRLQRITRLVNM